MLTLFSLVLLARQVRSARPGPQEQVRLRAESADSWPVWTADAVADLSTSKVFIWISDSHADPLWGVGPPAGFNGQDCKSEVAKTKLNPYGVYGCDPPQDLMISAVDAAARLHPTPEFVLHTGDVMRHGPDMLPDPWRNVSDMIGEAARIVTSRFPKTPALLGSLGNNDHVKNYFVNVTTDKHDNPWFKSAGDALVDAGALAPSYLLQYSYGGFYEQDVGGIKVITLSTVIYSMRHSPEDRGDPLPEDPFHQFAWLRERLQSAAEHRRPVWIVGHIPPGIHTGGFFATWHPIYLEQYLNIVQDPDLGGWVAAQLFGHDHQDEFRLLPNPPAGAGPILLTGAISPITYNHPSFRVVEYDPTTGRMLNVKVYYAELNQDSADALEWKLAYDLLGAYPHLQQGVQESGALYHAPFEKLAESMKTGMADYEKFACWFKAGYRNDLQACAAHGPASEASPFSSAQKSKCRHQLLCGLQLSSQEQYEECIESRPDRALHAGRAKVGSSTQPRAARLLPAQLQQEDPRTFQQILQLLHWAAIAADDTFSAQLEEQIALRRPNELAKLASYVDGEPFASLLQRRVFP